MEVKENKTNGQKYITLPKESKFKEGDQVDVIELKDITELELNKWKEDNKIDLTILQSEIEDFFSLRTMHPCYELKDYLLKQFEIKEDITEDGISLKLNEVYVCYNPVGEEIYDSNNYIMLQDLNENSHLFKEEYSKQLEEYTYSFDKEHIQKNMQKLEDSLKIKSIIDLYDTIYKEDNEVMTELMQERGFKFYDSDEFEEKYKHIEKDIIIKLPLFYSERHKMIITDLNNKYELSL